FDKFIDLFRVDEDNDEMTRKNEQETREETSNLDGEEVYDIDDITRPSKSQYQRGIRHQKENAKSRPEWLQKVDRYLPSPKNPIRRFWRRYRIGKLLFIALMAFILIFGSYLFYLSKTATVSDLQSALKTTTTIYDKNKEYAGKLSGQKGTYVELNAISDHLKNAVIATEDRT
ncbi:penicillin-binding protein, partial [Streptococcus agalactiae]|nr:penicillin-binding protein [Streptococcus agalactiae]